MAAAAMIGSAVIGGVASISAGRSQASAARQASAAAGDAASQEIAFARQARDEARTQLTPYSIEGQAARSMYNAAMNVDTMSGGDTLAAARARYGEGFEASPYWQDAQYSTGKALDAMRSTNAAMGRGSPINSGKALRAASDINLGYRGAATQQYLASLGGIVDIGVQADSGIASGGQVFANSAGSALRAAALQQGAYGLAGADAQAQGLANAGGFAAYGLGQIGQPKPIAPAQAIKPFSYAPPKPIKVRSLFGGD